MLSSGPAWRPTPAGSTCSMRASSPPTRSPEMRIAIERRKRPVPRPELVEIAAPGQARWFVVRTGAPAMRGHLEDQLGAAYPQAEIRRLDVDRHPGLDPARLGPEEQVAACRLALRRPEYLPLRTFGDTEVD